MGLPCCVDYRRAAHRPDPHASPPGAHRAGTAAAGCPLRGQQHLGLSSARAHLIYTPCRWCCCGGAETSNQQGNNEEGEGRCTYRRSTREFFCVDKCKLSVKCFLIKVEKYWVSLLHTHTPGSGWVEESVHRMSRDSTGRFTISDFFFNNNANTRLEQCRLRCWCFSARLFAEIFQSKSRLRFLDFLQISYVSQAGIC